jgi:hypothetical protein
VTDLPGAPLAVAPILTALNEEGVDYVVIGGIAGNLHGSSYPTFDLDVAYARDRANLDRLVKALGPMEVKLMNAPPDLPFVLDAATLANGANFTFDTRYGRFDILAHIPGVSSYEELCSAALVSEAEGIPIRVASIDHLIAMKRAAGRIKDRLMVEEYLVIADEQERFRRGETGA